MIQHRLKLLICVILFPVNIVANTALRETENPNPFSNSYTHDTLYKARIMGPIASQLPANTSPLLLRINLDVNTDEIFKIPVESRLCLPWLLVTMYVEPKPFETVDESLENSLKVDMTLGSIYRFPGYLRIGYDRLPFGHHASAIINAANMVTQYLLPQRGFIISVGFDYALVSDEQWSVSGAVPVKSYTSFSNTQYSALLLEEEQREKLNYNEQRTAKGNNHLYLLKSHATLQKTTDTVNENINTLNNQEVTGNPIINIRYQKRSPTTLTRWISFDYLNIGVGLGAHKYLDNYSPLFNVNSNINFGEYNAKFEYLYHGTLNQFGLGSALHTELSRRFSKLPVINRALPYTIVLGYEFGHRETEQSIEPVNNSFIASRMDLWKERITCIMGVKGSFCEKPSLLARLTIALPIS